METIVESYEHHNKPRCSAQDAEFLAQQKDYQFSTDFLYGVTVNFFLTYFIPFFFSFDPFCLLAVGEEGYCYI